MRETPKLIKKLGKCQKRAGAINSARRNDAAGGGGRRKRVYTLLINSSSTVVGRGRGGGAEGEEKENLQCDGEFFKKKKKSERDGSGLLIAFELKLQRVVRCDQSGGFPGAAASSREDERL